MICLITIIMTIFVLLDLVKQIFFETEDKIND